MAVRVLKGAFTVDDYHRLAEVGILSEDNRVELLDGQVVQMTPIGPDRREAVEVCTSPSASFEGPAAVSPLVA